ncbi:arrestin domain-containing protein 1-like isoform X2 [Chelonus insularis]|uniref:arrestin domain-containing protein 1-like isoform X2 n=1 Tax=Chelonus insularis TaxID=460826 RepID=UPI001589BB20|nr:arrestin domain-containing protein 1-like isoform X2 [Chelonus insularis]
MADGVRTFELQLNKLSGIYAPGETLRARIFLDLYKPKCIKALRVLIKGICNVNDRPKTTRGLSESVLAEEIYFDSNVLICGGDEITIPIGENYYLLSYELPENVPTSFSHKFASVRYIIKAVLEDLEKSTHEAHAYLRIDAPLKLEDLNLTPIDDTDARNVSKFLPCFINGYVRFRFRLPQNGFNCHGKIPLKINYINKSRTVDIKKMTCSLIQYITFHSSAPFHNKRTKKRVVETVTQTGAFPKEYEGTMELKVPDVPVSFFKYCKYIDVDYQLHVTVSFNGCNFKLKKIYDVVIASSLREFYDSKFFFIEDKNTVYASAKSSNQISTHRSRKPDVIDNSHVAEFPPSYDSIVSDHHGINHDDYEGSQNYHVDGGHHHLDNDNHHHVDNSNHHHVDNSNYHHVDSYHGCHDGGYSGGYDGGYDGGDDGGYDGGD